ncbi:hypothetical protein SYYSPA8_05450 [Streptomyces yaizuensis]|uniref:Uncharacterized protein n=1 Tax=Streptomyces yaizuensis TaxID=2989713 RepID=A0ABQ5NTL7_9ACTN|nr:hypothetical protein [Streptomyces sp. YSPA8]GLF93709.1 hypothetical protein SYYSPA8_05450 [Streptomyces sp. YSPA8]
MLGVAVSGLRGLLRLLVRPLLRLLSVRPRLAVLSVLSVLSVLPLLAGLSVGTRLAIGAGLPVRSRLLRLSAAVRPRLLMAHSGFPSG